jgi:hypothetical protein
MAASEIAIFAVNWEFVQLIPSRIVGSSVSALSWRGPSKQDIFYAFIQYENWNFVDCLKLIRRRFNSNFKYHSPSLSRNQIISRRHPLWSIRNWTIDMGGRCYYLSNHLLNEGQKRVRFPPRKQICFEFPPCRVPFSVTSL